MEGSRPTRSAHAVTRDDVARAARVSPAVVSYVLNDGPRPVADATRARVLEAIRTLGYRPNGIARALKLRRTHTLGLVVPDISNPFFAELAKAIEDAAFERGYALLLGNSSEDGAREAAQLSTLCDRQVDALMVIGANARPDLTECLALGVPVVALDRCVDEVPAPTVVVDSERGGHAATRHLQEHGHELIGCLAGPPDLPSAHDRQRGWERAMRDAGHGAALEDLVVTTAFNRPGGYAGTLELLAGSRRPTALFATSDLQAIGALRAMSGMGLRVPDDIAVVAFDGTQESEYTSPPLTVVRQPVEVIATVAVQKLIAQLGTTSGDVEVTHEVLPFDFIVRRSCGCRPVTPATPRSGGHSRLS